MQLHHRKGPFYALTVEQVKGGVHGKHCLCIHNFEALRRCGVAQNGKYITAGRSYRFSGWLKNIDESPVQAEIRFYATTGDTFATDPIAVLPLGEIAEGGQYYESLFENTGFTGWVTFALFITPEKYWPMPFH